MFYSGIGPTPPPIPTEYDLSAGCASDAIIPASEIEVGDITLCDAVFSINNTFASQSALITFLNETFLPSFGLPGSFYMDEDHLIYSTSDTCSGTNCIEIIDPLRRVTEDGINREIETTEIRTIE